MLLVDIGVVTDGEASAGGGGGGEDKGSVEGEDEGSAGGEDEGTFGALESLCSIIDSKTSLGSNLEGSIFSLYSCIFGTDGGTPNESSRSSQ